MRSICLPPGRWGLSERDGVLHRLGQGVGRQSLCGRNIKPIRTNRVPLSLPQCPACLPPESPPRLPLAQSPARRLVDALLRCR